MALLLLKLVNTEQHQSNVCMCLNKNDTYKICQFTGEKGQDS